MKRIIRSYLFAFSKSNKHCKRRQMRRPGDQSTPTCSILLNSFLSCLRNWKKDMMTFMFAVLTEKAIHVHECDTIFWMYDTFVA